jgi:hypothetical protein
MSDRTRTLTVILDQQYKDEDLEAIENAVRMVKGVQAVRRGEVADPDQLGVRLDIFEKLLELLRAELLHGGRRD